MHSFIKHQRHNVSCVVQGNRVVRIWSAFQCCLNESFPNRPAVFSAASADAHRRGRVEQLEFFSFWERELISVVLI